MLPDPIALSRLIFELSQQGKEETYKDAPDDHRPL